MKNLLLNKSLKIAIIIVLCITLTASVAFAVVLFSFRTDASIDGNTDKLTDSGVLSLDVSSTDVSFATAGEKKDITLTVTNKTKANIVYNFGLVVKSSTTTLTEEQLQNLSSSVLAYLDGEFIGTLAEVQNGSSSFGDYKAMAKDGGTTATHTLSLELHIASTLTNTPFNVEVTTYVQNADYVKYIFVSTEDELISAINDINTGLLNSSTAKTTIVLANDVVLSTAKEVAYPANIDLNGNKLTLNANLTLSGEGEYGITTSSVCNYTSIDGTAGIVLNGESTYLNIEDFYNSNKSVNVGSLYAEKVTLNSYDSASVVGLLKTRIAQNVIGGIQSGSSLNIFGALSFYASSIGTSSVEGECSVSGAMVTANTVSKTSVAQVKIGSGDNSFVQEIQIIGNGNDEIFASLLTNELKHIPNNSNAEAITYNVFLPKRIEDKNVSIEWTSSDENSISADGKLADTLKQNTEVTLYAKITINGQVYTTSFTFKVTSQSKEIKFKYLVAQLSPITLTVVDKNSDATNLTARFKLPSIDGTQDYRTDYTMISNDDATPKRTWDAYKDIGLTSLTYRVNSGYNFISVDDTGDQDGMCVFLNQATFYTFAQITVSGLFKGDTEPVEETINVIIKPGNNQELYELAFTYVEKELSEVDILQNLIDTRATYGRKYESGDFYLDNVYQTIALSYEPYKASESATNAITDAQVETVDGESKTHIYVDPSLFGYNETSLPIRVHALAEGDATEGAYRILYVNAPGVIKCDENGFANYSVFNTVKYQTAQQVVDVADSETASRVSLLPSVTVDGSDSTTGYTGTSTVTNTTKDYILVRDAALVESLTFSVGGSSSSSNSHQVAYNLAMLLTWATGSATDNLPFSFGTTYTSTSSAKADGKEYMNETEAAVIKAFLKEVVGFDDADQLNALWSSATETPTDSYGNGLHVISDYQAVLTAAVTAANSIGENYFKYTEVFQWATNEKDFKDAGGQYPKSPPDLGAIGSYNIAMDGSSDNSSTKLDWSSNPDNWATPTSTNYTNSKYYRQEVYQEDDTEYISDYEAQCIIAVWYGTVSVSAGKTFAKTFLSSCVVPTYLNDDGAGILINAVYNKLRSSEGNYSSALTNYNVPEISALDFSSAGITYFTGLKAIRVYGLCEDGLVKHPAFLTTSSLGNFFNRVTKMDADSTSGNKLNEFVMQACSTGNIKFDLANISRLAEVTKLDFSYNPGVTTIGDILNVDIKKISYLDVTDVNVKGVYLTYVLDNIKVNSPSAQIYYTDDGNRSPYTASRSSTSDELRFLKELTEVNSKYLLVTTSVDAGSGAKDIQWYVNSGNPGYIVNDAGSDSYTSITSADEMNKLLSNYYIFKQDVSYNGTTYKANTVYKVVYSGGQYVLQQAYTVAGNSSTSLAESDIDWTDVQTAEYRSTELQSKSQEITSPDYSSYSMTTNNIETNASKVGGTSKQVYSNSRRRNITIGDNTVRIYSFYQITTKMTATSTCRYFVSQSQSVLYYIDGAGVKRFVKAEAGSTANYIDIKISQSRTYETYYYSTSRGWGSTSLTRITESFSFSYNGSSYPTYSNMDSNGNFYSDDTFTATVGSRSYTGTTWESVYSQAVSYLDGLSTSQIDFDGEDTTTSSDFSSANYHDYVTVLSSADDIKTALSTAETLASDSNYSLYMYTGSTQRGSYYVEGNALAYYYVENQCFRRKFTGTAYTLNEYSVAVASSNFNMEAILAEANTHLKDVLFGNYYGTYYCYNGTSKTVNGHTYTKTYVYRLLVGDDGMFYFEHDNLPNARKEFVTVTSNDAVQEAIWDSVSGTYSVGKIMYVNIAGLDAPENSQYYANGLFELTVNSTTGVYYYKSMGGLGNVSFDKPKIITTFDEVNESTGGQNLVLDGVSKFINVRYVASDSNYYSGTGGSEVVELVARVINEDGTLFDERHYSVTVSI